MKIKNLMVFNFMNYFIKKVWIKQVYSHFQIQFIFLYEELVPRIQDFLNYLINRLLVFIICYWWQLCAYFLHSTKSNSEITGWYYGQMGRVRYR